MNYQSLTNDELLSLWASNRNALTGLMSADEIMNRVHRGDYALVDADEYASLIELQTKMENEV